MITVKKLNYKKELESKDAEIETLKVEVAKLAKKTVYGMLKTLRDKGLTSLEVITAANNAIEAFEDNEDRLEAERVKAIEAAEDAEEARFSSVRKSESSQANDILNSDRADYLGKIDNHWE